MRVDVTGVPDLVINGALVILAAALLLSVVRLVRGPSLMDRVVALELVAGLVVNVIAVFAIGTDDPALLDVAFTLALVAFLVERSGRHPWGGPSEPIPMVSTNVRWPGCERGPPSF